MRSLAEVSFNGWVKVKVFVPVSTVPACNPRENTPGSVPKKFSTPLSWPSLSGSWFRPVWPPTPDLVAIQSAKVLAYGGGATTKPKSSRIGRRCPLASVPPVSLIHSTPNEVIVSPLGAAKCRKASPVPGVPPTLKSITDGALELKVAVARKLTAVTPLRL